MKLFYSTGTCSMAVVNAIEELGIPCELVEVSWKRNRNVEELDRVSPLGITPTLLLDDGTAITQNVAVLEYLADQKPGSKMLAPVGTPARAITMSWLVFVAAELQMSFSPLFSVEQITEESQEQKKIEGWFRDNRINKYLRHIDESLKGKTYICGSQFTIADCYLFTISGWAEWADIDLGQYKELSMYRKRVSERPAIQRALAREAN